MTGPAGREMRLSQQIARLEELKVTRELDKEQRMELKRLKRFRKQVQRGLLITCFGSGKKGDATYRRLVRKHTHTIIWEAFANATETLAGKKSKIWRLKVGLVLLRISQRWRKRLERIGDWLEAGRPGGGESADEAR